jgi:hypothetical protein
MKEGLLCSFPILLTGIAHQAAGGTSTAGLPVDLPAAFDLFHPGTGNAKLSHLPVMPHLCFGELTVFFYEHPDGKKNQSNSHNQDGGYHEFDEHTLNFAVKIINLRGSMPKDA